MVETSVVELASQFHNWCIAIESNIVELIRSPLEIQSGTAGDCGSKGDEKLCMSTGTAIHLPQHENNVSTVIVSASNGKQTISSIIKNSRSQRESCVASQKHVRFDSTTRDYTKGHRLARGLECEKNLRGSYRKNSKSAAPAPIIGYSRQSSSNGNEFDLIGAQYRLERMMNKAM